MTDKIDLSGFTGTMQYHYLSFMRNIKATDGMAYLCEKAKCYWVIDIVASVQDVPLVIKHQKFLVWRIIKSKTGGGCYVEAYWDCEEDGTYSVSKLAWTQKLGSTDFPFDQLGDEFEFYQIGDVVLLTGEH